MLRHDCFLQISMNKPMNGAEGNMEMRLREERYYNLIGFRAVLISRLHKGATNTFMK